MLPAAVSQDVLGQIKALGFGTDGVRAVEGGYVVEGDMLLTPELLASAPGYSTLRVGDEEQYRTTNLVGSLPRVLTVSISSSFQLATMYRPLTRPSAATTRPACG